MIENALPRQDTSRPIPRGFSVGMVCVLLVLSSNTARGQTELNRMAYTGIVLLFNVAYDCFPCFASSQTNIVTPWSTPAGSEPTWSPDGAQVAFTQGADIFVTSTTFYQKRLTNTAYNFNPAWSPYGTHIAFVSSRDGQPEIYLMRTDGEDQMRLTHGVASRIGRPAWSPDSTRIAFNCEVDIDNPDICLINRDGSGFTRVTADPATDADPAWSPDGAKIAFSTTRFDGANLVFAIMNSDGTQAAQVGSGIPGWRAAWSPDGTEIAFSWYAPDSTAEIPKYGIYTMRPDGTEVSFLGGSGGDVGGGAYDADLALVDGGAVDPVWMPQTGVPVAVQSFGCTQLTCHFDGARSFDTSAAISSYSWSFGDGGTATGPTTDHTYARAGTYSATLTVTDENHATGTNVQSVTVVAPDVPPSVVITAPTAGASFPAPAAVPITADAHDSDGSILRVEFYAWSSAGNGALIGVAWAAPYTITWSSSTCECSVGTSPGTYTLTAVAVDNVSLSTTSAAVTITLIPPPPTSTPYGGTPATIPGTIQAENFDEGGKDVAYFDTTSGNSGGQYRTTTDVDIQATTDVNGGYNIGWTAAGEWLKYTVNVVSSGTYTLAARVACNGPGGTFHVEVDGADATGPLKVPNTHGSQKWTDVTKVVTLSAGSHVLRVVIDAMGPSGAFGNLNYVRFTSGIQTPSR